MTAITAKQFVAWQRRCGFATTFKSETGAALGLSPSAVYQYATGRRAVPRSIGLLMRYIERYGVLK